MRKRDWQESEGGTGGEMDSDYDDERKKKNMT
jgi:hypothetical protein